MSRQNDLQGRAYAKVSDVKPGTKLVCDGGFTCMKPWSKHVVRRAKGHDKKLYIPCRAKRHYLDGQIDGEVYIGLYLAEDFCS